jgi:hypothetical protein
VEHPREVEEHAQGLWGVEVVVHRGLEAGTVRRDLFEEAAVGSGRGRALGGHALGLRDEAAQPGEPARRFADALLGEVERVAVVGAEEVEAHGVGLVPLHELPDGQRVAERLRHLLGAQIEQPVVHPVAHEELPGRSLGLGDLAFVVREDQVLAASVEI